MPTDILWRTTPESRQLVDEKYVRDSFVQPQWKYIALKSFGYFYVVFLPLAWLSTPPISLPLRTHFILALIGCRPAAPPCGTTWSCHERYTIYRYFCPKRQVTPHHFLLCSRSRAAHRAALSCPHNKYADAMQSLLSIAPRQSRATRGYWRAARVKQGTVIATILRCRVTEWDSRSYR